MQRLLATYLAEAYRHSEHWWPRFPDALVSSDGWSWLAGWVRDRYGLVVGASPPSDRDTEPVDATSILISATEGPAP